MTDATSSAQFEMQIERDERRAVTEGVAGGKIIMTCVNEGHSMWTFRMWDGIAGLLRRPATMHTIVMAIALFQLPIILTRQITQLYRPSCTQSVQASHRKRVACPHNCNRFRCFMLTILAKLYWKIIKIWQSLVAVADKIKPASTTHSSNQFSWYWIHGLSQRCALQGNIQCGENGIRTKCTHIKYQAGIAISRAAERERRYFCGEKCALLKIQHKLKKKKILDLFQIEEKKKLIKNWIYCE